MIWLALYPFAWLGLFALSGIFWFLPAGLRLGTLWLLPRRLWPAMAVLEIGALLTMGIVQELYASKFALLAGAIMPWCIYATVLRGIGRHGRGTAARRALPRLLAVGFVAAVFNSILLTGIDLNDDGSLGAGLPAMLVSFALGDFAGVVLVVPIMLVLADQRGTARRPWPELIAYGVALAPSSVVLGLSLLPIIEAPIYPLALALLPLFLIAYRYGWRPACIAYGLLCLALVSAKLPEAASLEPGQLPLLMAMVGCAVLLLGAATETLRSTRSEMGEIVLTLRGRSAELSRAANRMAALQEQERRRIGVELHDQIGQDMTAIATRLRIVELTASNPAVLEGLASISSLVTSAHGHLREVINELHPAVLDRFGLARAIAEGPFAELLRDRGVLYTSRIQGRVEQLPDNIASALYRICQEAATNGARHGCGGRMHIRLTLLPSAVASELTLEIEDQFGPIAVDPDRPGRGLLNIRDRANAIGADYRFDAESGMPRHRVHLWLPIADDSVPAPPLP
ncbi:histidine kinase [Luteimonas notoginsengisoli]|uniref:histidine kinase n=1 Tax=Luteimonas notoginsengisoli TaxID=1578200 RepID=A0ABV7UVG7_9GAMM